MLLVSSRTVIEKMHGDRQDRNVLKRDEAAGENYSPANHAYRDANAVCVAVSKCAAALLNESSKNYLVSDPTLRTNKVAREILQSLLTMDDVHYIETCSLHFVYAISELEIAED
jgi:hypothetical protein